jgi:hypothetical protein
VLEFCGNRWVQSTLTLEYSNTYCSTACRTSSSSKGLPLHLYTPLVPGIWGPLAPGDHKEMLSPTLPGLAGLPSLLLAGVVQPYEFSSLKKLKFEHCVMSFYYFKIEYHDQINCRIFRKSVEYEVTYKVIFLSF